VGMRRPARPTIDRQDDAALPKVPPQFRLRTLLIAVAIVAFGVKLLCDWFRMDLSLQIVWLVFSVPIAIIVCAMIALWINVRAPH
jgi:hypothetical protein